MSYLLSLSGRSVAPGTLLSTGLDANFQFVADASGNLYIADTGNDQLFKEMFSGGVYTSRFECPSSSG